MKGNPFRRSYCIRRDCFQFSSYPELTWSESIPTDARPVAKTGTTPGLRITHFPAFTEDWRAGFTKLRKRAS